jgi:hypothetical protein
LTAIVQNVVEPEPVLLEEEVEVDREPEAPKVVPTLQTVREEHVKGALA